MINGVETYFEMYFEDPYEMLDDVEWIKSDITNEDLVISFVWGADYAAGACIGLISVALIDECGANIYYLDDEMKYSKEMLLSETPQFLDQLENEKKRNDAELVKPDTEIKRIETKKSFIEKIKDFFN